MQVMCNLCLSLGFFSVRCQNQPKSDWYQTFDECVKILDKKLDIVNVCKINRYNNILNVSTNRRELSGVCRLQQLQTYVSKELH